MGPTAEGWTKVLAPASCRCSDGTPYHYWVRPGDPGKVLFFLAGGGACFSAETCAAESATYTVNLEGDGGPGDGGIFDLDNEANPLADHSMVVVPYCTGDLHLGTVVHDYGGGVEVHHNGYANASTALAATAALFPEATEVVVAGSSAGSAGALSRSSSLSSGCKSLMPADPMSCQARTLHGCFSQRTFPSGSPICMPFSTSSLSKGRTTTRDFGGLRPSSSARNWSTAGRSGRLSGSCTRCSNVMSVCVLPPPYVNSS